MSESVLGLWMVEAVDREGELRVFGPMIGEAIDEDDLVIIRCPPMPGQEDMSKEELWAALRANGPLLDMLTKSTGKHVLLVPTSWHIQYLRKVGQLPAEYPPPGLGDLS